MPKEKITTNKADFIYLADPAIFYYQKQYYLYGTVEGNAGKGFKGYTSNNLADWQLIEMGDGYVLQKEAAFGTAGFWAPQVFEYNGDFYMAYVANEKIAIAKSKHPQGPFVQVTKEPLAAPVNQIDPFIFIDDDGKKYLYHVRLQKGNKIFVAEMNDDFTAIKKETLKECITATAYWENTPGTDWPVAEGPSVIKHKNLYYLFYTANDFRNPDYAVGYAVSNSPLGPWQKFAGNPILHKKDIGENGPGHGDFFWKGKKLYYVFHTHNSHTKVGPRRTALIQASFVQNNNGADVVKFDMDSFTFLHTSHNENKVKDHLK